MRDVAAGASASYKVTVGERDLTEFPGGAVHRLYGTAAMVRDMEYAARLVLLPLLEPGEEGVGAEVWCRHRSPTPLGSSVELVATVTEQRGQRLTCRVEAWEGDRLVGEGTVVQAVVDGGSFGAGPVNAT